MDVMDVCDGNSSGDNDMQDDLISRQAAIYAIWNTEKHDVKSTLAYNRRLKQLAKIINAVANLPSAQPEQRWIPCSERLPENKTYVLTTIRVPGRQPHSRSGWYEDGLFINDNGDTWKASDLEVKAWMPLPEPYQVERREDGQIT